VLGPLAGVTLPGPERLQDTVSLLFCTSAEKITASPPALMLIDVGVRARVGAVEGSGLLGSVGKGL